jgi:hypothetical protein
MSPVLLLLTALAAESIEPADAADPIESAEPAESAEPPAPTGAASARGPGAVTASDGRQLHIDRGATDGLSVGDAVGLYDRAETHVGGEVIPQLVHRATGRVTAVGERAAIVAIGVNAEVPVGAVVLAEPGERRPSSLAPPRVGGRGFFTADLRGLVSLADAGGGVGVGGSLGYRFRFPLAVELRAAPVFLGVNDRGGGDRATVGKGSVVALVSFDHHLVGVGLGGGVALNPTDTPRPIFAQRLRLGAADGLMFTYTGQLTWYPTQDGSARWAVDLNEALVQVPLTSGKMPTWLVLRGAGGVFGGGGYVGARVRVAGNGERGTWGLTPFVGVEHYQDGWASNFNADYTSLLGPAFGATFDTSF